MCGKTLAIVGFGRIGKEVAIRARAFGMNVIAFDAMLDADAAVFRDSGVRFSGLQDLIRQFKPQELAIEAPFYGKNVQSMLKLGRAQGIAIAMAMQAGIPVTEYSPRKVKQSITGNGNANKEQVWKMLQSILTLPAVGGHVFDASDALAVAVCHHFNSNPALESKGGKANNWEDFIRKNADRIRK